MAEFTTVMTWLIGALLAISALLSLIRVVVGPSVLDRVVATDVLVSVVVCALGAYVGIHPGTTELPLLVSLSLIGFISAVAVARFVSRDRDYPVEHDEHDGGAADEGAGDDGVDEREEHRDDDDDKGPRAHVRDLRDQQAEGGPS